LVNWFFEFLCSLLFAFYNKDAVINAIRLSK
jgi:hypothetical protein